MKTKEGISLRLIETRKVKVQKRKWEGKDYLDIRIWFEGRNNEWYPTRKGITIPFSLKEKLIKYLQNIK